MVKTEKLNEQKSKEGKLSSTKAIMIENLPFVLLELEETYAMVAFRIHIEKIAN